MVEPNPWIDKALAAKKATSAQLTQSDRAVVGVVSGTHESDPVSIPEGWVEVTIPDSTEPPVVVPSDGGITGLDASVLCGRDSSGRIVSAATPQSLPAGAKPVAVGVTGECLAGLDSLTASLSSAQTDLDAAQAQLVEHLSEVGINAHSSVITEELWARLAVFAKVTTQMLIAGDATITGEMIVNELVGKILRGGMIDGGEVWMRGQAAGSSQVQYAEQFTSAASGNYSAQVNGWQANHSTGTGWTPSTGLSIASGGQSGNCLKVAALSMPGTGSGAIVRSANSNMFSAVTTNGTKRVEAYIKAGAKTKVRLGAYVKYPGIDTTNSVWTDTVVITANTWTKMTVDVPVGFIITGVIFSLNDATDSTAIVSRDVFVDTVTVTTTFDLASNIRLYQTPDGYPTLDLTDANGLIRARLSSGKDNFTGLSFFSNDGDAMTFTGGGLYMTKAGPGQTPVHLLTWPSLIESANRESYTRSGAADVPAINGNGWALVTVNYSSPITAGISYRADATLVGADGTADRCTVSCTFLGVSSALFRVRNVTTGATGTGFRLHWKIERGGDE